MAASRNLFLANDNFLISATGDDADLVIRAKSGDAAAYALLYRRYVNRVYDFAARRLPSREAAEDATQVVFLRVATSLNGCRDGAAFPGWVFAIARNVVADSLRTSGRDPDLLPVESDAEDPDPTPEQRAIEAEQRAELQALRERCLNARERELFDLLLADLNDKEIATILRRRHGAIRTAHWRLLAKLRQCLGIFIRPEARDAVS